MRETSQVAWERICFHEAFIILQTPVRSIEPVFPTSSARVQTCTQALLDVVVTSQLYVFTKVA